MNWNQEQPVMLYVRELIGKAAPEVAMSYGRIYNRPNHPSKGVGGFAARHTANGGFSRHSEGRACDIYVNTSDLYLRLLGDALFKRFAANHRALGIEDLLWDTSAWSHVNPHVHRNPDIDSIFDHQNHLHVGFSRATSQTRHPLIERIITSSVEEAKTGMPLYEHAPRGYRSGNE